MIHVDLQRFEEDARVLEQHPVRTGGILLYGSSLFTHWGYVPAREQLTAALWPTGTQTTMSPAADPQLSAPQRSESTTQPKTLNVTNHGIGGATIDELLFYYARLVRPCAPELVLMRTGLNDLANGYNFEEIELLLIRLIEWIGKDFPKARMGLINFFDVPREDWRTAEWLDWQKRLNEMFLAMTDRYAAVQYVDLNEFVYEEPRYISSKTHFRPYFVEDGLHLTEAGYVQFGVYLATKIRALFGWSGGVGV